MSPSTSDIPKPSPPEIREQLGRVLNSEHFRSRPRPAQMLTLLVEKSIDGTTLDEDEIRAELYADVYDQEGTNVRTTISIVRGLIGDYNKAEGLHDPVTIALPKKFSKQAPRKGQPKPYPVVCTYNRLRSDLTHYTIGLHRLRKGTPREVRRALEIFETILRVHPEHLDAKIARLECLCLTAIYLPCDRTRTNVIEEAALLGASLARENPNDWRVHALTGIACACCRHWPAAAFGHTTAVRLNPDEAKNSLWYPFLALLMGLKEQALAIARQIALERVKDCSAWAAYGFCLYVSRQYEESETIFLAAVSLDPHSWMPLFGIVFVYLATGRPEEALKTYTVANKMVAEPEAFMPGLGMLAASKLTGEDAEMSQHLLDEGRKLLLPPEDQRDWLQIALAIVDREPADLNCLILARQFFQPLVQLVSFWPVFDPLRRHPNFDTMMQEIRVYPEEMDFPPPPSAPPI